MTSAEARERILRELGSSNIMVELDQGDLDTALRAALELYSSYTNEVVYVPVNFSTNPISLEKLNIASVIRVFESPNGVLKYPNMGEISMMYNPQLSVELAIWNARISNMSTVIDKNWRVSGTDLYVESMVGNLTIEAIKRSNIEDVRDPYWQNWVVSYATAKSKEIIGTIRGKYTLNNAPYQLDADTIRSQGLEAQNTLKQELNTAGGFFTILR